MPADRTITLAVLDTTGTHKVEVKVAYDKGGYNYFTYGTDRRGYWLHVTPVDFEETDGILFRRYTMGTGIKRFVAEAKRFGAKGLAAAAADAAPFIDDTVAAVCLKEGLTLEA